MTSVSRKQFESFVTEGIAAIPEKFRSLIKNVAFLVGDRPTLKQRRQNNLRTGETLLGLYEGIPRTARGEEYGGLALPDRITIFRQPIEQAARDEIMGQSNNKRSFVIAESGELLRERVRQIVMDTVWHEVAHHFGLDEAAVKRREVERGERTETGF
ncbi:MAG TPA: metallopeptidase family protein [Candidatus Paceibacterota bacterium]